MTTKSTPMPPLGSLKQDAEQIWNSAINDNTPLVHISMRMNVIVRTLIIIFFTLLTLHVLSIIWIENQDVSNRFFFDREGNLPSFFSTLILLLSSGIIAVIAFFKKQSNNGFYPYWLVLSVIFLLLAIDENSSFHEVLIDPLSKRISNSGIWAFAWVIPAIPAVILLGVIYLRFLLSLPVDIRFRLLLSAVIYIAGAIGMEMVGAYFWTHEDFGPISGAYMIAMTVEESLEMIAIICLVSTLLSYSKRLSTRISIDLQFV